MGNLFCKDATISSLESRIKVLEKFFTCPYCKKICELYQCYECNSKVCRECCSTIVHCSDASIKYYCQKESSLYET